MECLLPYFNMVTVPHQTVGLERMSDYRGVGLQRFHCRSVVVIYQSMRSATGHVEINTQFPKITHA